MIDGYLEFSTKTSGIGIVDKYFIASFVIFISVKGMALITEEYLMIDE